MNQNDHNNQSTIGFDAQKKSVITVDVISASDLPAVDHHGTSCDPYVIVCVGKECQETKSIKKNINPEWNRVFHFRQSAHSSPDEITFKLKDRNSILPEDKYLGEGTVSLNEVMGEGGNSWEGKVSLHGKHIQNHSTLTVRIERSNQTSRLIGVVEKVTVKGYEKTSNIANLALITAHNHMTSRKLAGIVEVEVKLGILVVVLQAEVEQHESKEVGHIDVVEDSEANNNVDEPKPTKGMQRILESSIAQTLDNMQTQKVQLSREYSLGFKAGVEIDLDMIPMFKASVKVLMGLKMKVTSTKEKIMAKPGNAHSHIHDMKETHEQKGEEQKGEGEEQKGEEEAQGKKTHHQKLEEVTARLSSEMHGGKETVRDLVDVALGRDMQTK